MLEVTHPAAAVQGLLMVGVLPLHQLSAAVDSYQRVLKVQTGSLGCQVSVQLLL